MSGSVQSPAHDVEVATPKITVDRTGWLTVTASPAWWRRTAVVSNWAEFVEELAAAGEKAVSPGLCGVIGVTTGTPCLFNTTFEPCPHHGPGNEKNRCGAPTASGRPCRWNMAVRGECSTHPQTWQRLLAERRAQEEEDQRQKEAAAQRRAEEHEQRCQAAQEVPCPYCSAQPGAQCTQLGTSVPADVLHKARLKLYDHLLVADATECESCGAEPGQVCQTTSGKDATDPHAARVRAAAAANAAARDSQNR